jgi:tartrate dehydrogenase/decarboxylase/D-malate dehydrogenase
VNLRPVRLWPGVPSPLRDVTAADVDMVIVRENNEGEYSEIGGRLHRGTRTSSPSRRRSSPAAGPTRIALRLRAGGDASARTDLGHQVQRHHPHDAVLGRALRADRAAHPRLETEQS